MSVSSDAAHAADTDDLRQMRDSLRSALGTARSDPTPAVNHDWRSEWSLMAQLGVTGLCVPKTCGGYGFETEASATVAQEFGAALHGSPYAGLTASAHVLGRAGGDVCSELARDMVAGERICVLGILDTSTDVLTDKEFTGAARLVDGAADADALLLVTRTSSDALLVADRKHWTIEPAAYEFDVSRSCGDVRFDGAPFLRCGGGAAARRLYGLLLTADALGGLQRMLDRTVAYVRERQAFGRPVGAFQAVQHRLVDHTIRVRGMELVVAEAARMLGRQRDEAARQVALAELVVSSGATHILHDLVQLTGAIGFTWEYGLHLYERRAHHDARLAGNPRAAARALACFEGWEGGATHEC